MHYTAMPPKPQQIDRIANAIEYVASHVTEQPSLEELSQRAGLSSFHFHRLFRGLTGVTPKQFLQHCTVESAKERLADEGTVLDTALDVGLSGPSRLHDHFVTLESMTPGEWSRAAAGLPIAWGWHRGPFGALCVAETDRGICSLEFVAEDSVDDHVEGLRQRWPEALLHRDEERTARTAARLWEKAPDRSDSIRLHVSGTNHQVQVWRALLALPAGATTSYGEVSRQVGSSPRAVGQAVGANPVAVLIPCHRVLQRHGKLGGYRWGTDRKRALLAWESARNSAA